MDQIQQLISQHINIWTSANSEKKSSRGRSSGNAGKIYGIEKLRELIYEIASLGNLIKSNHKDNNQSLSKVSEFIMGQAPPGSECNTQGLGTVFVKTGEFGVLYPEIREWTTKPLKLAKKKDVLICVVGATIGKLNLAIDCAIGRSVAAIRPNKDIDTKYLYYMLIPFTIKLRNNSRGSAQGVIGKTELSSIKIRVPPMQEQLNIVNKIDELMALCDQLEQQHINSEEAHQKLVKVLLETLTQSKDAEEFKDSWQRIADHFDTLFTTQGSINELKQTLLELAVMGKLVSQDPNDEPARDLLKRLQEDKVKNITKASNKKDNLLSTSTDLSPFKLPYTWVYEKLGNLSSLITKGTTPTSLGFAYETNGINFIKVENIKNERINLSSIDQFISPETNNALSRSQLEEGDVLFSIAGTIGKTCIVNKEDLPANTNQALAIIRGTKQIFNQNFLLNQLNSLVSNKIKEKARGGAMNNVSLSDLSELIVVIPPTHEQDRIITKLDELMTLCDELKSRIQQASAKQKQIADVLVSQALH